MKRITDPFLDLLEKKIQLKQARVLEIGCGDGSRAVDIASRCSCLVGIDPILKKIEAARLRKIKNATFYHARAESITFIKRRFDVVIFSLSLHHIKFQKMPKAISKAALAAKSVQGKEPGYVVFLEPGTTGSFFDAEIQFGACDGDERVQKEQARQAMESHPEIVLVHELFDETVFKVDSVKDFTASMEPTKNLDEIESFLREHDYTLRAERRISIYQAR